MERLCQYIGDHRTNNQVRRAVLVLGAMVCCLLLEGWRNGTAWETSPTAVSAHPPRQVEYAGLIAGLAAALRLGCTRLKVQGDSNLVIQQVGGLCQMNCVR